MPVCANYYINIQPVLFLNVFQVFALLSQARQAVLALFSFVFMGQYYNTPGGTTAAGENLFLKGIA